jgi:hypothetical protein
VLPCAFTKFKVSAGGVICENMIGRPGKRNRLFGKMFLALCTGPREERFCRYREEDRTATPQAIIAETWNASRPRGKSKGGINRDATVGEVEKWWRGKMVGPRPVEFNRRLGRASPSISSSAKKVEVRGLRVEEKTETCGL